MILLSLAKYEHGPRCGDQQPASKQKSVHPKTHFNSTICLCPYSEDCKQQWVKLRRKIKDLTYSAIQGPVPREAVVKLLGNVHFTCFLTVNVVQTENQFQNRPQLSTGQVMLCTWDVSSWWKNFQKRRTFFIISENGLAQIALQCDALSKTSLGRRLVIAQWGLIANKVSWQHTFATEISVAKDIVLKNMYNTNKALPTPLASKKQDNRRILMYVEILQLAHYKYHKPTRKITTL